MKVTGYAISINIPLTFNRSVRDSVRQISAVVTTVTVVKVTDLSPCLRKGETIVKVTAESAFTAREVPNTEDVDRNPDRDLLRAGVPVHLPTHGHVPLLLSLVVSRHTT